MRYCGLIQGPKCTIFADTPTKSLHFSMEIRGMYKPKDRTTQILFPELFPFGGILDQRNRWLRIRELIPGRSSSMNISSIFPTSAGRERTPSSSWGCSCSST